jgi:hypothetical protein
MCGISGRSAWYLTRSPGIPPLQTLTMVPLTNIAWMQMLPGRSPMPTMFERMNIRKTLALIYGGYTVISESHPGLRLPVKQLASTTLYKCGASEAPEQ